MKEIEVTVQMRNNCLKERREVLGFDQKQLALAAGIGPQWISLLETMRVSPLVHVYSVCPVGDCGRSITKLTPHFRKLGYPTGRCFLHIHEPPKGATEEPQKVMEWRKQARVLAEFFECEVEELFPQAVLDVKTSRVIRKMDAKDISLMLGDAARSERRALPPDSRYDEADLSGQVSRVMETLTEREEEVIKKRFGLGGEREHTLEEIGEQQGVSRDRIRQIEAKALRNLRHPARSKHLKQFVIKGAP